MCILPSPAPRPSLLDIAIPMALNDTDVARIAKLARIELTPDQRGHAQAELNGILHLIERLQAVDTQGVEPLALSLIHI